MVIEPAGSELDYEVHTRLFLVADECIVGRDREVSGEATIDGTAAKGHIGLRSAGFMSTIGTRDRHVAQILQADAFPEIGFDLTRLEGFDPRALAGNGRAEGTLTVRDRHVHLAIPLSYQRSGTRLLIYGAVRTRFSDFGIVPPVLGLIIKRAPDDVLLKAHLVARIQ